MPVIGNYKQQPSETLDYDIDFADFLPSGDAIESAVVSVFPVGLTATYAIRSPRVKVWCYGGANGVAYKVTITATTKDGRVKEVEFKLKVVEQ